MLCKNLLHQAVLAGHSALFITASDLLLDLNGQETSVSYTHLTLPTIYSV